MNQFSALSLAVTLAASLLSTSAVAAERAAAPVPVVGEKVDSGLGDLPHYSKWADPTGKNPLLATALVRDNSAAQRLPVQVSQAR